MNETKFGFLKGLFKILTNQKDLK